MPSPIAHSAAGYAIARMFAAQGPAGLKPPALSGLYGFAIANAADLDFIPQLLTGERYHRGFSHSLLFSVGFAVVVSVVAYWVQRSGVRRWFWLTLALYVSHLGLDWVTDGGEGIQLLWPFQTGYFRSPVALFPSTHWSEPLLQNPRHLLFVGVELTYTVLLLGLLQWLNARKRKGKWQNRF